MHPLQNIHPTTEELAMANGKLAAENARYKEELQQAQASLQQHRTLLGQFSHQFRTPLAAIVGHGELLHGAAYDGETKERLSGILDAADSLLTLLNDLPAPHDAKGEPQPRPCALATLVPQLEGFFAYEARRKGLEYTIHWDASIPEGLYCDLARLRQVLLILVHNAIRFTAEGQVSVRAALSQISDHEAGIAFTVEDTGIGITPETLPHLFTPADRPAGRFGRAGRSLPLAAQWVESMGGTLRAESAPGEGSRFSFRLAMPIQYPREIADEPSSAPARTAWRQARVLVVDDDAMNRELLAAMAHRLGINHVDTAADGEEATARALEHRYDLILMDCQMPRMDGFTATRQLRRNPHTAELPIIGITADVIRSDTAKCYAAGMDGHQHKPVTLAALERIFHEWLEN